MTTGMTLYDIDINIAAALGRAVDPETGEIIDEQAAAELDQLQMDRNQKVENIGMAYKNARATAEALKAEIDSLRKRYRAANNAAESLKKYAAYALQGEKFETPRVKISYRKVNGSCKIDDPTKVPLEYLGKLTEDSFSKTAIKAAIQDGKDVPGAHLEDSVSTIIK